MPTIREQDLEALNFADSVKNKAQERYLPLWQRCLLTGLAAGWAFFAVEAKSYAIAVAFLIALFVVGVPAGIVAERRRGIRLAFRQNPAVTTTLSRPYIYAYGGVFLPFVANVMRDQFDSTPLWVRVVVAVVVGPYVFWLCGLDRYARS